jgi:hypothetical protein
MYPITYAHFDRQEYTCKLRITNFVGFLDKNGHVAYIAEVFA